MVTASTSARARQPVRKRSAGLRARLALVAPPPSSDALAAAHSLYRATLELLSGSDDPSRDRYRLAGPLSTVVAGQRTRIGQSDCADLARALERGDPAGALDACRRLIELEGERAGKKRHAPG
jgi:hypothetical protein